MFHVCKYFLRIRHPELRIQIQPDQESYIAITWPLCCCITASGQNLSTIGCMALKKEKKSQNLLWGAPQNSIQSIKSFRASPKQSIKQFGALPTFQGVPHFTLTPLSNFHWMWISCQRPINLPLHVNLLSKTNPPPTECESSCQRPIHLPLDGNLPVNDQSGQDLEWTRRIAQPKQSEDSGHVHNSNAFVEIFSITFFFEPRQLLTNANFKYWNWNGLVRRVVNRC